MNPEHIQRKLNEIKVSALVFDIETSASWPDSGKEINIKTNFDDYVSNAKVKWFGCYSYKYNKGFYLDARKDVSIILDILKDHEVLVGFNSEEFDYPILKNNGLVEMEKKYLHVDCMQILGTISTINRQGFKYKNRGELMDYKFKNNSLKCMAETMKLGYQKSTIDYKIFFQNTWTLQETNDIKLYLQNDVMVTKQMFDKLWEYWLPFSELLDVKNIYNLSWIRNSIASLTYKAACKVLDVQPTFSDKKSVAEEMGGNVIDPKLEEANGVWYVDFGSLYPHIFTMFNLADEMGPDDPLLDHYAWHGNNMFKVRGHYYCKKWHPLSQYIADKLKQRIYLKETDPKNPMIYTLKIFLNGLYGIFRSSIFEQIHKPNCGWDCCWLGQQIQQYTIERMNDFGFDCIYGDTDSAFFIARDKEDNTRQIVLGCLKTIVDEIKANVPFPVDTFKISIENYLEYLMFPFSEQPVIDPLTGENKKIKNRLVKEFKGKKKNYMYTYRENNELKIKIVGFPLIKDNATSLGPKIYEEILKPEILKQNNGKFEKQFIEDKITEYLKDPKIMELIAVEYKVNAAYTYKKEGQIQAQISRKYFQGNEGNIKLVKNNIYGDVGKGQKYCSIEEALQKGLTSKELDLDKVWQELSPFIKREILAKTQ